MRTSATLAIESIVCTPADSGEVRAQKVLFTMSVLLVVPAGIVWALIYYAFGARGAAVLPLAYALLTVVDFGLLRLLRRYDWFRVTQLGLIFGLPVALQISLGGFASSSAVMLWSFIAVLLALLFGSEREARWWFGAFFGALVLALVMEPMLTPPADLPPVLVLSMFGLNIGAVSTIAFVTLQSFMADRRKLRALEVAYLGQEVMLREKEKLATLGTLAAGVAHELNNPASAVTRSAATLRPVVRELHHAYATQCALAIPDGRLAFERSSALASRRLGAAVTMSSLERSDREETMADWLTAIGLGAQADEFGASLASAGFSVEELQDLTRDLPGVAGQGLVLSIARLAVADQLLQGITEASQRISHVVAAVRSYAFLDQAPVQLIDLADGVENTLSVLGEQALSGIRVERSFAHGLPRVQARGSELNQAWTHIIRNALDAMGGTGTLTLRTSAGAQAIVVEIEDTGPGMSESVAARAFDPFFTTKPPGKGAGLGLAVSHTVIVQQHGGRLEIDSKPGRTVIRASIPLAPPAVGADTGR